MFEVMQRFRPGVVFHAAAYKHVPLMESNPLEAVRNNAIATRITAETAAAAGAGRFVLISTDKAVTPQTVMGASKALAEWAVGAAGERHAGTRFVSVRFGNVLGSSGSVVPIFRRQIEQGGPMTVTHPDMTRFFMTIPEAVQLVIRAGDTGNARGDVFVLDMGDPVKIVDLAENMIRLAGFEPEKDIAIEFTGTRPGEKIHEELFGEEERPSADRLQAHHARGPAGADRDRLGRAHARFAGAGRPHRRRIRPGRNAGQDRQRAGSRDGPDPLNTPVALTCRDQLRRQSGPDREATNL